jgi:Protein of unknown function (DUF3037)
MMGGNPRRACEFQLLRYVPDAVRNEYVHIGAILREQGSAAAEVRFTRDWRRVRCLDPDADTALLEGMEDELRRRLMQEHDAGLMKILEDSLSLNVQLDAPKAYLAESVPAGMEELMRLYVEPPPRERTARMSGRAAIHARMRGEFERAGVWELMRKRIAASEYTRPGDPLRIDAGYRPNGMIRMFHAVSLESRAASGAGTGLEAAKALALSAAPLRAGVERVEKAELELTAVIEPVARSGQSEEEPEGLESYRFGVETMEEHAIRVLTTSDLGRVAETARRELRV